MEMLNWRIIDLDTEIHVCTCIKLQWKLFITRSLGPGNFCSFVIFCYISSHCQETIDTNKAYTDFIGTGENSFISDLFILSFCCMCRWYAEKNSKTTFHFIHWLNCTFPGSSPLPLLQLLDTVRRLSCLTMSIHLHKVSLSLGIIEQH